MTEKRTITRRCGHKEEYTLATNKTGKQGKNYLNIKFEELALCLGKCDCRECSMNRALVVESAMEEIEREVVAPHPPFMDEGRWNKKFYGKKGYRSIYINEKKRNVSEDEYEQWQIYIESLDRFWNIRNAIMSMSIDLLKNKEYRKLL